jgi:hypothetical protein
VPFIFYELRALAWLSKIICHRHFQLFSRAFGDPGNGICSWIINACAPLTHFNFKLKFMKRTQKNFVIINARIYGRKLQFLVIQSFFKGAYVSKLKMKAKYLHWKRRKTEVRLKWKKKYTVNR